MSPELISKRKICPRSDCWSIGVCYFEFLVGVPPFNAQTESEVFQNITNRKIDWPEEEGEEDPISDESRELVENLLQTNPFKRPLSAEIFENKIFTKIFGDEVTAKSIEKEIFEIEPPFVPDIMSIDDIGYFMPKNERREFHIEQ